MKNKLRLIYVFLVIFLISAACEVGITTTVHKDETGEMGVVIKITQDEIQSLASYGMNAATICDDLGEQGGSEYSSFSNLTFKQEEHGDETWCLASQIYDNLRDLKAATTAQGISIRTMEIEDGKFIFDASADMSDSGVGMSMFSVNMTYTLEAPGKIDKDKSNAGEYDGNTATWNLSMSRSNKMYLESSASSGGFDFKWWYAVILLCCCLLVILVIAVVVFFFMRQQKLKQQTTQFVPPAQ